MLLLVLLALCNETALTGFAASPTPTCAPLAPPPVSGSPVLPPATPGIVLLNEILTNPGQSWNCAEQGGAYSIMSDSWVEMYNPQSQPFNLYEVHAYFDDGPNTFRFYLPFGAAIAPYGFLVVFPNSAAGSTLLAGSNLRLMFAASSTAIDEVSIPGLAVNDSYARIPDGSPTWDITTTPTIDSSNIETSSVKPTPTTSTSSSGSGSSNGSSGSGASVGSGSSSGSAQGTTTPTLVTGTQPAWNRLSLPSSTPAAATPTTFVVNSPLVNTPSSGSSGADTQRRILLTALLILLAGSILWCWKVYSS
jgi:hypothetical protein